MLKNLITIAGSVALLATAACSSVSTNIPSTRFESPEVPGHLRWRVSGGGGTAQQVTFTNDASIRPLVLANTFSTTVELPIIKGSLGLSDRFEIGVKYGFPSSGMLKTKFQILGDAADIAVKNNFSLAVTAGIAADYTSKSGNQEGLFGPGGYNWSASSQTNMYDFSIIAGIRPDDHLLVFLSPFVTTYSLSGSINQAASDNGQSPASNYTLYGNGQSYGGSLGIQVFFGHRRNMSIMTDLTGQVLQWSTAGSAGVIGGGVLFEFLI